MAVTSHVFPYFTSSDFSDSVNLDSDTIKCALYNYGSTPAWNSTLWAVQTKGQWESALSISEITGTGYTAGGVAIPSGDTSVSVVNETVTLTVSSAGYPTWSGASFTAWQALFYDASVSISGVTPSTNPYPVICYWDFGAAQQVADNTFTLSISTSGLLTVTAS